MAAERERGLCARRRGRCQQQFLLRHAPIERGPSADPVRVELGDRGSTSGSDILGT